MARARTRIGGGRQEVVESNPIGDVDRSELKAPLVAFSVEKVVISDGDVEEMTRGDAGGIVIGVVGSRRGDRYLGRSILRSGAESSGADGRAEGICRTRGRMYRTAEESCLELLVGAETGNIDDGVSAVGSVVAVAPCARCRSGDQTTIVSPVESQPGATLPGLVLEVGGLIKLLVVVNAEDTASGGRRRPCPPNWGSKKREATLEKTMSAEKPWKFGTLTRPAYPGILELCHSMGNVIGVLPRMLKS